ncbi:MAG: NAD(P)/FAD-dependent oxidoreductase [Acidobacteria bacterium]|nr:NAD(P)/FAD-dependent oxidoreductase [Acidobacteriota bacterium]
MRKYEFDGVIIGAGHNALVMAGYLAKSGLKVAVLERTAFVGGGAGTFPSPFHPGFVHEYHSQFHRAIPSLPWYKDLDLDNYGLEYIYPPVNNGMPLSDGRNLIVHADPEITRKSIARFSKKDAENYVKIYHKYADMGRKIWFVRDYSPPIHPDEEEELLKKSQVGREFLELNKKSAHEMVHELFENDALRAFYLFLFSVRGYLPVPTVKNTGFSIVAMTVMGNKAMLPRGGARQLTNALSWMVARHNGTFFPATEVAEIIIENGRAAGVEAVDGRKFMAKKFVVSSVDPTQTFLRFISEKHLDSAIIEGIKNYKYGISGKSFGVLFALHAATHEPPHYTSAKWDPMINQAFNTCVGYETPEAVVGHLSEVMEGTPTENLGIQCAVPTLFDPSRSPNGKHVLLAWQFAPYSIKDGGPEQWEKIKDQYLEKVLARWAEYAPNLDPNGKNIIYKFSQTPPDTERHLINMREGDFHVGALIPEQLGYNRPIPQLSGYKAPIDNLYLTGAGTHPGGNITGAPGYNAAQVVIRDLGMEVWWNPPDPRKDWSEMD